MSKARVQIHRENSPIGTDKAIEVEAVYVRKGRMRQDLREQEKRWDELRVAFQRFAEERRLLGEYNADAEALLKLIGFTERLMEAVAILRIQLDTLTE